MSKKIVVLKHLECENNTNTKLYQMFLVLTVCNPQ